MSGTFVNVVLRQGRTYDGVSKMKKVPQEALGRRVASVLHAHLFSDPHSLVVSLVSLSLPNIISLGISYCLFGCLFIFGFSLPVWSPLLSVTYFLYYREMQCNMNTANTHFYKKDTFYQAFPV